MFRKVLLLLVVGMLLIGIQAFAQTFELSQAQMEDVKAGCWAMCDKVADRAMSCWYSPELNKSYEVKPVRHYVCSFSIWPANCSNFASLRGGEVWSYVGKGCKDVPYQSGFWTEPGCGLYP